MESIQKLELFISCRQLADLDTFSKSDPFCILFVKKNNNWSEYGRTELIWDNLNPNFSKSIIIDYYFEIQQHIKFEVHHHISNTSSQLIGSFQTTISAIAGSKDQVLVADLKNNKGKHSGKIIVRADQVRSCNDDVRIVFSAENICDTRFWFWHSTSPFLRFYRLRKDDPNPIQVYETEFYKSNLHPTWKPIQVKAQKLCNGDYFMPIKVELWDHRINGAHIYLGETQFTFDELRRQQKTRTFVDKKHKRNVGDLIIKEFKLIEKPSFLDYIAGGVQLNLIVAIDFTASNQNPHHPSSLHYRDPKGTMNQYQQAILGVGEILVNYDYDKKIPVFGFGCQPKLPLINTNQTLHCFPINGNPNNPEVDGLEGIMNAYANVLPNVKFDGPTYFGPILNETMKVAAESKQVQSDNYFILLILTDGEIHDMRASIDAIIASSLLPLSVIIVGIGNADFGNMQILDNDDMNMTDSQGRKAIRDLVQFVPFNEFKGNPEQLAKNVLEELPDQLVNYMILCNIKPKQHNVISLSNFGISSNGIPNQPQPQPVQGQYIPYQQQTNSLSLGPNTTNQYYFGQQQQASIGVNTLTVGMAKQGFLNPFIQQGIQLNDQQLQMQQSLVQNDQKSYKYP